MREEWTYTEERGGEGGMDHYERENRVLGRIKETSDKKSWDEELKKMVRKELRR